MEEKELESKEEIANNKIRWSFETNWIVAHGSLESSVAVDSFEDPIEEPDPESTMPKPPLVLKPPSGPDSGPCEVKIRFDQKYDINQIYVRSTARTYEVYYAQSPHSGDEYLCTIRCGVAERDEKVLQTTCFEDGSEEREESTSGETCVSSEDDWVKIKDPDDDTKTNRVNVIQDYYEATAQINNAEPCTILTIRLLSLQDKSLIYVDEVYLFASQVQLTVTTNEEVLAGSSTQSSLMAMFVPALLQMSKSRAKSASDELLKDDRTESSVLRRPDYSDTLSGVNQVNNQYTKLENLQKDTIEVTPEKKPAEPVDIRNLPSGHIENALEHFASRVSRVEDICLRFEEKLLKPIEKMEARLQQLELQLVKLADNSNHSSLSHCTQISEGICLKFEEKLLKPIENMEARLRQVELQLEKGVQNPNATYLPHCTRFSAPDFSCSESNSSSFYKEGSHNAPPMTSEYENKEFSRNNLSEPTLSFNDCSLMYGTKFSAPAFSCSESDSSSFYNRGTQYPPSGTSESANKEFSCNNLPDLSCDMNRAPSLVLTAPEFSHEKDEEYDEDLKQLDDPPSTNVKKGSSIDEALASALSGFLSTAKIQIETSSGPLDEGGQSQELNGSFQNKEVANAEKSNRESLQDTPFLTVKTPQFITEEVSGENQLNDAESELEIDSVSPKKQEDRVDEKASSLITSADLCDHESNKSIQDPESATNGNILTVSNEEESSDIVNENLNRCLKPHRIDTSVEADTGYTFTDTVANSAPKLPKDFSETAGHHIYDELETIDDNDITSQQVSNYDSVNDVSDKEFTTERCFSEESLYESHSSRASFLDFEFPILEVKFSSDISETTTRTPLEDLLDGMSQLNFEVSPINISTDDDYNREDINFSGTEMHQTTNFVPSDNILVDLGASAEEEPSNLGSDSQNVTSTVSSGLTISLI